jgi:hypothetical protein
MDNSLVEMTSKVLRGLSETDRQSRLSLTSTRENAPLPADGPLDLGRKRQWHSQLMKAAESVSAQMPIQSQRDVLSSLDMMQLEFLEYKRRYQMVSVLVEDMIIEQVLSHGHLEVCFFK